MAAKLSHDDKRDLVRSALNKGKTGASRWIRSMFDDSVVFEEPDGAGLKKAAYTIGDDGAVTLGDAEAVIEKKVYHPVKVKAFTLDATPVDDEGFVVLTGKVFELGDYPDKSFSLSEAEADASVTAFEPVANDLEHLTFAQKPVRTILDGHLGSLSSVARKGKDLVGSVRIPKWLHQLHPEPIGVSLVFDEAKRIIGNALTLNPRIEGAAVAAAFTSFTSIEKPPDDDPKKVVSDPSRKENRKPMKKDSFISKLATIFTAAADAEVVEDSPGESTDPKDKEIADLKAKLSEAEKAKPDAASTFNADAERARAKKEAERKADELIREAKAVPAERDAMVTAFTEALLDDNPGVTCFSADGEAKAGKSFKRILGLYEARPAGKWLAEFTKDNPALAIPASGVPNPTGMTPERRAELLGKTYTGKTILKEGSK